MKQAVLKVGAAHLDMVRKLEPALESAGRDAAMQEGPLLAFGSLLTLYR